MARYSADGDKQKPGNLPDNAYDRATTVSFFTSSKTPNEVYIGDGANKLGFYFGTSASFADLDITLTGNDGAAQTMSFASLGAPKQITGSGTSFTTELKAGDKIQLISASVNYFRTVSSIKSNTSMSIVENWTGTGAPSSSITSIIRRRSFMSKYYENFGLITSASTLHINPIAVSGSTVDNNKNVVFIYRSGLAGPPRSRR